MGCFTAWGLEVALPGKASHGAFGSGLVWQLGAKSATSDARLSARRVPHSVQDSQRH